LAAAAFVKVQCSLLGKVFMRVCVYGGCVWGERGEGRVRHYHVAPMSVWLESKMDAHSLYCASPLFHSLSMPQQVDMPVDYSIRLS
jgi:hypothetical protein